MFIVNGYEIWGSTFVGVFTTKKKAEDSLLKLIKAIYKDDDLKYEEPKMTKVVNEHDASEYAMEYFCTNGKVFCITEIKSNKNYQLI